ncbi:hypothetical protein MMC25_002289 [Agyrium rufum]|nr:hypothetical protein [Agyrium rufum]
MDTDPSNKRKAGPHSHEEGPNKKSKGPKRWRVEKSKDGVPVTSHAAFETGDQGVWATCDMHRERKCIMELRDLLSEACRITENPDMRTLLNVVGTAVTEDDAAAAKELDIEGDIESEIQSIKKPTSQPLLQSLKVDVKCVTFIKTMVPIDPVALVHSICKDAMDSAHTKKSRWIKRLTPMSMIGKATEKGIEDVARIVLGPHFHQPQSPPQKFAIRTTIRNHTVLNRDIIIQRVAALVGDRHTVDLKNYDSLILVEVYKNICGMSVVGGDYEQLKRYNLSEIYEPSANVAPSTA